MGNIQKTVLNSLILSQGIIYSVILLSLFISSRTSGRHSSRRIVIKLGVSITQAVNAEKEFEKELWGISKLSHGTALSEPSIVRSKCHTW